GWGMRRMDAGVLRLVFIEGGFRPIAATYDRQQLIRPFGESTAVGVIDLVEQLLPVQEGIYVIG
ncbi:hypothetical protein, partial [Pseudomonas sp. S3E12]|uniref:hypothetical protein n=1 Tax=Pseudomonas sp. S3E12 TaxID=1873126 RepID=UPI001C466751